MTTVIRKYVGMGCLFFLQAEHGIRGVAVTGVQTCALPISVEQGQRIIYLETQRLVLNSFIEMTWNRKTLIDQRLTAPGYKILRHRHVCGANFPPTHRAQADVEANWLQIAIFANEKVVCATLVHHLAITSGK